jgi:hypothetical protein
MPAPSIDTIANITSEEAVWIQDHYRALARVNTFKTPYQQATEIMQFYADTGIPPEQATLDTIFTIGCSIEDHFAGLRRERTRSGAEPRCNTHYWNIMVTFSGAAGSTLPIDLIQRYVSSQEALRFFDRYGPFVRQGKDPISDEPTTFSAKREDFLISL